MGPSRYTQCRAVIWILYNRRFLLLNISQNQRTVGFVFSEKKKYQNWRIGWFRLFSKRQRTGEFHDELAKNRWWLENYFFLKFENQGSVLMPVLLILFNPIG
jgi:hypothetical protein